MERTPKTEHPDVQRTRDAEEREDQRREDDTNTGARRPDTGERDDPPQPFTGPHH